MDNNILDNYAIEELEKYIELYENSKMPVAILDKSLRIVWCNNFINTNIKAISDNKFYFNYILSEEQKNDILSSINRDEFITIEVDAVTSDLATVSFAPIYTNTKEERKKTKNVEKNSNSNLICAFIKANNNCSREKLSTIVGIESKVRCALANVFTSVNAIQNRSSNLSEFKDIELFLNQITKSTYQVLKVIGTLSTYTKIVNGLNTCNFEVVKCSDFFDNFLYAIKALLLQSGVEINYLIKISNDAYFRIDKEKMKRFILQAISININKIENKFVNKVTVLKIQDIGEDIVMDFVHNNVVKEDILGKDGKCENADSVLEGISHKILEDTIHLHSGNLEVIREQKNKVIVRYSIPFFKVQQDIGTGFLSSYDKSENLIMDKFSSLYIELSDLL